jgi:hypothetical protein
MTRMIPILLPRYRMLTENDLRERFDNGTVMEESVRRCLTGWRRLDKRATPHRIPHSQMPYTTLLSIIWPDCLSASIIWPR